MDNTTQSDSITTQGLQALHPRTLSLSRLKRAIKRAKKEARIVIHQWNRHTFIADVFGPRDTWMVPGYEAAEWGFIQYLFKTHSYTRIIRLSITTIGSLLVPPLGIVLYTRFLVSTRASEKVRYIGAKYADRNREADEEWWFINGTGVNGDLQAANGYHISEIFQKHVRLWYNPTTGLLFDFAQCVAGLLSYKTRPSARLAKSLRTTFAQSPTVKVILIVHSMGAIIAANAIKYMIRKGMTKDLHRLEVYTFGSPAVEFLHVVDKRTLTRVPFYEHYVNTHDFFGSIGALRLVDAHWWAVGRVFTREHQGHFFGEHYLVGFSRREYKWRGSTEHSRLYSYLPPYPTPAATFHPYTVPEYRINPRRPRRPPNVPPTPVSSPPLVSPLVSSPAATSYPVHASNPFPSPMLPVSSSPLVATPTAAHNVPPILVSSPLPLATTPAATSYPVHASNPFPSPMLPVSSSPLMDTPTAVASSPAPKFTSSLTVPTPPPPPASTPTATSYPVYALNPFPSPMLNDSSSPIIAPTAAESPPITKFTSSLTVPPTASSCNPFHSPAIHPTRSTSPLIRNSTAASKHTDPLNSFPSLVPPPPVSSPTTTAETVHSFNPFPSPVLPISSPPISPSQVSSPPVFESYPVHSLNPFPSPELPSMHVYYSSPVVAPAVHTPTPTTNPTSPPSPTPMFSKADTFSLPVIDPSRFLLELDKWHEQAS